MGSYVSSPVTDKESTDESNEKLVCGASSMQGWRLSQEDAHNCILDYDKNTSFFAVYDGHGGHEVAQYCAENLPQFIKDSQEYKENNIEEALCLGFLRFDATIATPEVIAILKKMEGHDDSEEEEDEENVNNLYEEAAMPIEQVIEKYTSNLTSKKEEKIKDKNESDATVGTSSVAACSSSSSTSSSSCDDVSSTSEAQSSEKNGEEPENGDANVAEASVSNSSQTEKEENPIQNGEISTPSETNEIAKNDVTSSSTPVENGTPSSKKGKGKALIKVEAKKAVNTRPKRSAQQLYKNWLDFGEEDSEESSDEEDQTFEGPNEESSDDEESVNVAIDVSEEESSDDGEEEEESDDENEMDELDEKSDVASRAIARSLKGEPGSDSGCTAVVALLRDNQLYVANAGDSRCIVCRNGKAIEMSIDHKPEDEPELERIIAAGGVVRGDGRVNGGLNLSRAIGDHAYKKNKDLSDRKQMITALPDIKTLTIDPNEDEFMVLACDGIWNSMSSQEVVDFVRPRIQEKNREKLSTICEEIFDHCLAPHTVRDGTGCDNMTAVIVKFKFATNKRPISPHPEENDAKRTKTEDESEAQVDTTV